MIRFFHLADLHYGIEFDSHSSSLRQHLRRDMRQAFSDMIDRAISESIDGVLIAGDLLDDSSVDPRNEIFLITELKRLTDVGIDVYLVQGNHDVSHQLNLPGVTIIGSNLQVVERAGYRIVGQSFEKKFDLRTVTELPTFSDDLITIGLFHTQIVPHLEESNRSSYLATTISDLEASGYDYLALGHVHERSVHGNRKLIHYPGSFFPLSRAETGRKGYLDIRFNPGLKVQFIPSSQTSFARIEVQLDSGDDFRLRTYEQLKEVLKPDQISMIQLTGYLLPSEMNDLPEILELVQEESELAIDFIDQTQVMPQGDLTQNPFFQQLFENFDSKVFRQIDEVPLHQLTPSEYRLWYAKNKDRLRRMMLESFYDRGNA